MKPTLAKLIFGAVLILSIISLGDKSIFAQLTEIENNLPKIVPLKVEFKHYDKENWWRDLEIKVTNTGKKPIYFLSLLMFLDKSETGKPLAVTFHFGDPERLHSTEALANSDDPSILPGESYKFRTPKDQANAWDLGKRTNLNFIEPSKGELRLGWLNFGDGTSIEGGGTTIRKKAISDRKP